MRLWKNSLELALNYAFEIVKAKKVTLGVFENNPSAYYCYKAAGFKEMNVEKDEYDSILGEKWKCIEMEVDRGKFYAHNIPYKNREKIL